jgi:circadian clock protein KaiC
MNKPDLVKTGIAGLDEILRGGIPRGNIILVQGIVGAGKTLFGVEFIYRGITEFGEPGIIVLFETTPAKIVRDAATFGWNLEELQQQKKLQIVFTAPQVLDQELRSPDSLLLETAIEMGARRIFIDGIGLLREPANAAAPNPLSGPNSYRELLQQLIEALGRENLTAVMSHGEGEMAETQTSLEATSFLADTVIQLSRRPKGRHVRRTLEILKSRGQDFDSGEHTLQITDGKGLQVFRRVQLRIVRNSEPPASKVKSSMIGVEALDGLIGGGIYDGTATLVVGNSGMGKTVLATQILREGAIRQNKRGLLISLDEQPAHIVRNAESLGLDLQKQIDNGMIHIFFECPQELDVDAHYAAILQIIQKEKIERLVVDGMSSYMTALGDISLYRDFVHALIAVSKYNLITVFLNYESPEFVGIYSYMPECSLTSIVDNIVLLSFVELGNSLRRCVTVVKSRGSGHELDTREYVIGQGGITLLPPDGSIPRPLPLSLHSSLLSRSPMPYPCSSEPFQNAK